MKCNVDQGKCSGGGCGVRGETKKVEEKKSEGGMERNIISLKTTIKT